ncbi:MAG: methionyl-tRNA formyltransferase, partial [Anaerolineaceae bacterium]|nr:methionyl-tRNA formyltransferase [Anaerolineaceae bacterium]
MGSPDFALPILKALHHSFLVVGVVTQPDRPGGRGRKIQSPPIKSLADRLAVPIIQPQTLKDENALLQIQAWAPDVIVVAAFGQILRSNVLNFPKFGCMNVHASLLPCWRGASPIQAAILNGDKTTGVTIMKMDEGLDTGPILTQREVSIPEDMTGGELSEKLADLGAELLVETLPLYIQGLIEPRQQNNGNATSTTRIKKSEGLLDFSDVAINLVRKVRAYNPWPGTFFGFMDRNLKIHKAHVHEIVCVEPYRHYIIDGKPAIGTSE